MVRLFDKENKDNDNTPPPVAEANKQEVQIEVHEVEINLTLLNQKLNYLIQQVEEVQNLLRKD